MKKIDIHLHPYFDDDNMNNYVACMDKAGVVAGLVHGIQEELSPPKNKKARTRKNYNELVRAACAQHKGKLYGSVCLDFNRPVRETISEIKDFASCGFISVKLFPNYGYNPADRKYDRIWETVEKLGL